MDKEQDDKMVTRLISLRQSSISIVDKCFGRDADFRQSISSAFEFFINKRENKPAEMMAKFLDQKLRSGNRGMDDAALEAMLDDVLFLFRFTQGECALIRHRGQAKADSSLSQARICLKPSTSATWRSDFC